MVRAGGWAGNVEILRTLRPGYPAVAPNAALGILLCALAL